ncbi:MAG: asparagine synthase (glutamine-hydrolyzing) [Planctomycetota bacterium]|jgi:asparagine synthase (glutamine-hydrolysing)|nr:asparagine synthase (glutamine-hydrolyzing) [Planctomycetota bacterium]
MCGICGIVGGSAAGDTIAAMTASLAHRGPDADGMWQREGVALGHRRLAVIDLSGSAQPMVAPDGTAVLAYNGEIYNYQALRDELQAAGHAVTDAGDTGVLLAAWQLWGAAVLPRLRGIFAFAVWDPKRQELTLVRDHFGIKPLYYSQLADGGLAFGSEAKALRAHPGVDTSIDLTGISLYLERQFLGGERSVWNGIKRLAPGSLMRWRAGQSTIETWYRLPFGVDPAAPRGEEAVDRCAELVEQAVCEQMVSDVPLGAFLSGGVDSSLAVAIMARHASKPVTAYTIAFGGDEAGDPAAARAIAKHVGIDHRVIDVTPAQVLAQVERIPSIFDEPFGDNAALPTLVMSAAARSDLTVVLSGEGADEVFGGYDAWRKRDSLFRTADAWTPAWSPLPPLLLSLPNWARKDRVIEALSHRAHRRYGGMPGQLKDLFHRSAYTPAFLAARQETMRDLAERASRASGASEGLDRITAVDSAYWLPDDLLAKVDRTTMAVGLEARVPYLDPRLFAFALSLPAEERIGDRMPKRLLKRVAERYMPKDLVYRPKSGFVMPLGQWLRQELAPLTRDCLLSDAGLGQRGLLRPAWLQRVVGGHLDGSRDDGFLVWVLLQLELWFRTHASAFRL